MITTGTAILGSALLTAGASAVGAFMQNDANQRSIEAQTDAAAEATAATERSETANRELSKNLFAQTQKALKPWQDIGMEALRTIRRDIASGAFDLSKYGYQDLIKDPGYKFRVAEGQAALERSAAARGNLISGDQLIAANQYGQQMASDEFDRAFARTRGERDTRYNILADQADIGLNATTALTGARDALVGRLIGSNQNVAGQQVRGAGAVGSAVSQGAINSGNIWAGLSSDIAGAGNQFLSNSLTYNRLRELGVAA